MLEEDRDARSLEALVAALHAGPCPECGGSGPVDLHPAHWVWSAAVLTRFGTNTQASCRACGVKAQLKKLVLSAALGWWGFPFGLFVTPVQIGRTTFALLFAPDPSRPSKPLEAMVRARVSAQRSRERLQRCASCGASYDPDDYREDADHVYCSMCNAEIVRV